MTPSERERIARIVASRNPTRVRRHSPHMLLYSIFILTMVGLLWGMGVTGVLR